MHHFTDTHKHAYLLRLCSSIICENISFGYRGEKIDIQIKIQPKPMLILLSLPLILGKVYPLDKRGRWLLCHQIPPVLCNQPTEQMSQENMGGYKKSGNMSYKTTHTHTHRCCTHTHTHRCCTPHTHTHTHACTRAHTHTHTPLL